MCFLSQTFVSCVIGVHILSLKWLYKNVASMIDKCCSEQLQIDHVEYFMLDLHLSAVASATKCADLFHTCSCCNTAFRHSFRPPAILHHCSHSALALLSVFQTYIALLQLFLSFVALIWMPAKNKTQALLMEPLRRVETLGPPR